VKGFMDVIMIIGFVLFMVWIIRGYHANKYEERYGDNGSKSSQKQMEDKN
jgi:hypothetical protein